MTITIVEQVDELDLYGSLLRVFHRRDIEEFSSGTTIEQRVIVPIFESDPRIEKVVVRVTLDGVYFLAWISGRWVAVSLKK